MAAGDGVAVAAALGFLGRLKLNLGRVRGFKVSVFASPFSPDKAARGKTFHDFMKVSEVLASQECGRLLTLLKPLFSSPVSSWLLLTGFTKQLNHRENKTDLKSASSRLIHNKYLGTKVVDFSQTGR